MNILILRTPLYARNVALHALNTFGRPNTYELCNLAGTLSKIFIRNDDIDRTKFFLTQRHAA